MTPDAGPSVKITVRVPESVRAQLDALAAVTGRPRQSHALDALRH